MPWLYIIIGVLLTLAVLAGLLFWVLVKNAKFTFGKLNEYAAQAKLATTIDELNKVRGEVGMFLPQCWNDQQKKRAKEVMAAIDARIAEFKA